MPDVPSVLFVCLGNICRSPLAEAALRHAALKQGVKVTADSAGTGGWHVGDPPDPRSIRTAARFGIDMSGDRARQISTDDFTRFDHIIAMDHDNLRNLQALAPVDSTAKLSLLLDHVPGREGQSVADPYYGGEDGFATTWADVCAGTSGWLERFGGHQHRN